MLAPGVPSNVAHAIGANENDPNAMAHAVVSDTMNETYGSPTDGFAPAAAFDVIDLDPAKTALVQSTIKALDADLLKAAADPAARAAIRADGKSIDGMVRFPESKGLPWHADRPAVALYQALASDTRLSTTVRSAAASAADAVSNTVMAHRESDDFAPFNDASYSNAFGPTVHFPVAPKQVDPWAKGGISETDNAFYKSVGGAALAKVIA